MCIDILREVESIRREVHNDECSCCCGNVKFIKWISSCTIEKKNCCSKANQFQAGDIRNVAICKWLHGVH